MDFINHITLNSGQARKSYFNEIHKGMYPELLNIVNKALEREYFNLEEYSQEFKGYSINLVKKGTNGYMLTLLGKDEKSNKLIPIMTSFYSKGDNKEIIEEMHKGLMIPLKTKPTDNFVSPYILDRIELGAIKFMEAMGWSGDFSRCIAWACLFPEKLK